MTSALLVIDMQNGFVHEDGSLPRNGKALEGIAPVIAQTRAVIDEARARMVPVIYTRHVFRPDFAEAPHDMRQLLSSMVPTPLVRGTWDADIVDELAPVEEDVVVDKCRYDAFLGTDLETVLRCRGITRLLVTGVVTSVCVESTVRSGHQRDLSMLVASDCVAGREPHHGPSLDLMRTVFAQVAPWRYLMSTCMLDTDTACFVSRV